MVMRSETVERKLLKLEDQVTELRKRIAELEMDSSVPDGYHDN